jgi:glycosyltransferase involved in cell wall biosynthesis
MRLGLLTTSYPSSSDETSGAFVEAFARALVARGHRVDVLAPMPEHGGPREHVPGLEVSFLPYAPRGFRRTFHGAGVLDNVRATSRAWPGLLAFPAMLAHAAASRAATWDGIVSHFALPSALVGGLVRRGLPHLAVAHSADLHLLSRLPGRRALARRIEAGSDALWFVSNAGRALFEGALGRPARTRVIVSPMGISAPVTGRRTESDVLRVVCVGRLVAVKGVDVLVDALAGLENVRLTVVGDGPERASLEARARSLDVGFVGAVPHAHALHHIAHADVLVLPSRVLASGRTEGAPVVLLEAMQAGVPIIASAVGGVPELVGDAACLVPPDDAPALHRAMRALQHDGDYRASLGAKGRVRAARHTWPELARLAERALTRG